VVAIVSIDCWFNTFFYVHILPVGDAKWTSLDAATCKTHVLRLLDMLELSDRDARMKAARAVLYLCQGGVGWGVCLLLFES
jgi:hypothetical protein